MSLIIFSTKYSEPNTIWYTKAFCLLIMASLVLLVTLSTKSAFGAQVTLAWDPSSDANISGYKLYWGSQSKQYTLLTDVGNNTSETISNLQAGTIYYFAATAYDVQGNESSYSNEVSYTVPGSCTYSISPASKTFTQTGGKETVAITTQSTCSWTASSGASWMTLTSGSSGTGNGTVSYTVSANAGTASRTSISTIAGQVFTVTQTGVQTYTLVTTKSGTGSGTITNSPSGLTFNPGTSVTLSAIADAKSSFAGWSGACSGTGSTCAIIMNSNVSVNASFAAKVFTITANTGTGGTITPSGSVSVNSGDSQSFTVKPNSGYRILYLIVDGKIVYNTSATSYTFSNVQSNHTISVYFRRR
jgi:hypothetical protein